MSAGAAVARLGVSRATFDSSAALLAVTLSGYGVIRLWTGRISQSVPGIAGLQQPITNRATHILRVGLGNHVQCAIGHRQADSFHTPEQMQEFLGPEYAGLAPLLKGKIKEGYNLIMAHRCTFDGRQFVHLIVRKKDNFASVVITRKAGESSQNRS